MPDLLTLTEARTALHEPGSVTADDLDLTGYYIPALTPLIEWLTGPILVASATLTVDGGKDQVTLPSAITGVTSVTENGVVLTPNSDYVVNLRAGIVSRGTQLYPFTFLPGHQNITVVYTVGTGVVPPHVKMAARKLLRWMWLADQQGEMPGYAQPDGDLVQTPSGEYIPREVYELLKPTPNVPGFA